MFLDRRLTRRQNQSAEENAEHTPKGQYASAHCWLLDFEFRNAELAEYCPVSEVVQALLKSGLPRTAQQDVHTILNELYVNALDYGVLGLADIEKNETDEFYDFHRVRRDRLQQLARARNEARVWIKIDCMLDIADRPSLVLTVADSGSGFSAKQSAAQPRTAEDALSGRGLQIVRSLVQNLEYSGRRNQIRVTYQC